MKFIPVDYVDWVVSQISSTKYNLSVSNMRAVFWKDYDLNLPDFSCGQSYHSGLPQLKEKLADIYGTTPDNIFPTVGATYANFLVCSALIYEGDEVVIEKPTYQPLYNLALQYGARIKEVNRKADFSFDMEAFKAAITPNTKIVIMTNLHNPTGRYTPMEEMQEIYAVCEENNAFLLVDEAYLDFASPSLEEEKIPRAGRLGPLGITTASFTKTYGIGGIRNGWIMANPEIIRKAREISLSVIGGASVAAETITAAYAEQFPLLKKRKAEITEGQRKIFAEWLKNTPEVDLDMPPFGITFFPRLPGIDVDYLVDYLLENYGTLVVPGRFFGHPDRIRISIGADEETVRTGLENLGKAIRELK